jgi:extradiol dioxygenase family protein
MLREHPIHATIPAADLERTRAFYADKLGLSPQGSSKVSYWPMRVV